MAAHCRARPRREAHALLRASSRPSVSRAAHRCRSGRRKAGRVRQGAPSPHVARGRPPPRPLSTLGTPSLCVPCSVTPVRGGRAWPAGCSGPASRAEAGVGPRQAAALVSSLWAPFWSRCLEAKLAPHRGLWGGQAAGAPTPVIRPLSLLAPQAPRGPGRGSCLAPRPSRLLPSAPEPPAESRCVCPWGSAGCARSGWRGRGAAAPPPPRPGDACEPGPPPSPSASQVRPRRGRAPPHAWLPAQPSSAGRQAGVRPEWPPRSRPGQVRRHP